MCEMCLEIHSQVNPPYIQKLFACDPSTNSGRCGRPRSVSLSQIRWWQKELPDRCRRVDPSESPQLRVQRAESATDQPKIGWDLRVSTDTARFGSVIRSDRDDWHGQMGQSCYKDGTKAKQKPSRNKSIGTENSDSPMVVISIGPSLRAVELPFPVRGGWTRSSKRYQVARRCSCCISCRSSAFAGGTVGCEGLEALSDSTPCIHSLYVGPLLFLYQQRMMMVRLQAFL